MNILLLIPGLVILIALLTPISIYLMFDWKNRQREIFGKFSDEVIRQYYESFFPAEPISKSDLKKTFYSLFNKRFGRRMFIIPLFSFFSIIISYLAFFYLSIASNHTLFMGIKTNTIKIILAAFLGALIYILFDFIKRERRSNLTPFHVNQASLRLIVSLSLSLAIDNIYPKITPALLILLGVFPASEFWEKLRYLGNKLLGKQDQDSKKISPLEKILGIDSEIAECFLDEGIQSNEQLAYADPIDITIRTNLSLAFVMDIISQALAIMYLGDCIMKTRQYSLRGALEIESFLEELDDEHKSREAARLKLNAQATLDELSKKMELNPCVVDRLLRSVTDDPHYWFLASLWWETEFSN